MILIPLFLSTIEYSESGFEALPEMANFLPDMAL